MTRQRTIQGLPRRRRRGLKAWAAVCLWGALLGPIGGCASPYQVEPTPPASRLRLSAEDYRRFGHEAVQRALRGAGYQPAMRSARLGRFTSEPQRLPTVLEFWAPGHRLDAVGLSSSINQQRRRALIELHWPEPSSPSPAELSLVVRVWHERANHALRFVDGPSAGKSVFNSLGAVPSPWRRRGIQARQWRRLGRDRTTEAQLHHRIARWLDRLRADSAADAD